MAQATRHIAEAAKLVAQIKDDDGDSASAVAKSISSMAGAVNNMACSVNNMARAIRNTTPASTSLGVLGILPPELRRAVFWSTTSIFLTRTNMLSIAKNFLGAFGMHR